MGTGAATPLVSVVMPAYNCAGTVLSAIDSVLGQSMPEFELIIVDDGSEDDSVDVIQRRVDERIRLLRHSENSFAAAARNTGVRYSRADHIAFIDSDDVWTPTKLEVQLNAMNAAQSRASVTEFAIETLDEDNRRTIRFGEQNFDLNRLAWGCYQSPGTTLMLHRDLVDEVGEFDERFRRYEDWDWLLRYGLTGGKLHVVRQELAVIRATGKPSREQLMVDLHRLRQKHGDTLRTVSAVASRAFLAGLAFERAAAYWNEGRYALSAFSVLQSLSIHPFNHYAIRRVVLPKFRRQTSG